MRSQPSSSSSHIVTRGPAAGDVAITGLVCTRRGDVAITGLVRTRTGLTEARRSGLVEMLGTRTVTVFCFDTAAAAADVAVSAERERRSGTPSEPPVARDCALRFRLCDRPAPPGDDFPAPLLLPLLFLDDVT